CRLLLYSSFRGLQRLPRTTLFPYTTLFRSTRNVPPELTTAAVREGDLFSAILLGNLIHTSTVLFRRSWCERTGGFDESYSRAGEDRECTRLNSSHVAISYAVFCLKKKSVAN